VEVHTTIGAVLYKLKQSQDPQHQSSPLGASGKGSIMERALDSLAKDIEKDIVMFETSCQLLSRLTEMTSENSSTNNQSKLPSFEPLPLMQHIRTLVNDQFATQLTSPAFIEASSYKVLDPLGPNTVSAWKGRSQDGKTYVILNDTAYPDNVPPPIIRKTVQHLAYMLSPSEVMLFGLPQCIALIRHGPTKFRYVLSLPAECVTPVSLRSKYTDVEPSLSVKISYAKTLC